ncbi:hypothetical protein C8J57DRAFT_1236764 [Mycena rebaudengoi]|nr:hypothetical protein C8J57DRAFT_1236764 [Mycena rebaudengoi]
MLGFILWLMNQTRKSSVMNIMISIPDDAADEGPTRKKPKTKIPKERDILPANEALNGNIGALRANGSVQLLAVHVLKGEQFATVEKPPNTGLFDAVGPAVLAARSPLLNRHLELQEKKSTSSAPQITNNIHFPPELMTLLHPAPAIIAPLLALTLPVNRGNLAAPMLIPFPLFPGPNLAIEDFCGAYNLDHDVTVFIAKNFDSPILSKIAGLKVAIASWAKNPDN